MSFANGAGAIASGIDDMYRAFLAGDQAGFDTHLHDDVTVWETHVPNGLMSRRQLDAYRQGRDLAGSRPRLTGLEAHDKRIDVWGEVGVARYELVAIEPGAGDDRPQRARVTDVFRRIGGRWLIVHHHAEAWCEVAEPSPQAHLDPGAAGLNGGQR